MTIKLNKKDRQLLAAIAEHRVLTTGQVTAILHKSRQVVRRRLRQLEETGIIVTAPRGLGHSRGRPEKMVSLTREGVNRISDDHPALRGMPIHQINGDKIRCMEHHLLTNWFRIHLAQIERVIPALSIHFLSPDSPFLKRGHNDIPFIFEQSSDQGKNKKAGGFTPDGVFSITHAERQKTILFFLEVDMGTESMATLKREPRDIRQKVINYQEYFRSNRYKRYEEHWHCNFKGFRLLFLAHTYSRVAVLSRLVSEMPPSDFIWLTSLDQMFTQGLLAEIWIRGGKQEAAPASILTSHLACQAPILPLP
jgi:DNA-binding transcriptional ArsR family regulator